MTDLPVKYYEEYLMKKEGKGKWKEYWVVIRGTWMLFYANKNITDRINFQGSLELSKDTKCSVSKRRNYSFPFYITTQRGTHLFKCSSNLQRHQWTYVIGLALKGAPALSPHSFVPKATVQDSDGDFMSSWDTSSSPDKKSDDVSDDNLSNIIDDDDEKDDDDDDDNLSLPPGVIIVSTLPDDLSKVEGDAEKTKERELILNSINADGDKKPQVPLSAVLSTGITGSTYVVREKSLDKQAKSTRLQLPNQTITRPVSKSTGSLQDGRFRNYSMTSKPPPQAERPNTSPLLSTSRKTPLSYSPANSSTNLKFSRHMTNSAPDVKTLAYDNIIPRA